MKKFIAFVYVCLAIGLSACEEADKPKPLFQSVSPYITGIEFINQIENSEDFNIFNYRNFYNGGGVGLGDINNDGLLDIYFTANQGSNKLYKNLGDFRFEDITDRAQVALNNKWSTGVSLIDINADGFLDIYVCNAGYEEGKDQKNSLFVNNGDETFTESAAEFGLDHQGYSTHAAFFDYDKDGDLDVYILNNSFIPVNTLNYTNKRNLKAEDWPVKDFLKGGGDVLLKNDNNFFMDVTDEAGIYSSLIGFGLGVTVGDVNNDHWDDIYISNDFFERDYLYINQQDGTFSEELEARIGHTSLSSMGADMADLNNDGHLEIFVTDMLPHQEHRLKTTASYENIDVFNLKKERGFYNQYMQNTLQLNDGKGNFSEIANYAKVQASDWSWGALLFDADNDMFTDIFISNGILNDVIDQDFIDFFADEVIQKMVMKGSKEKMRAIIDQMPSVPIKNILYKNLGYDKGGLEFENVSNQWGFTEKTFSNGAAYGDLDNDGDLDLVVNNVNQAALIYQNNTVGNNFIQIQLRYTADNLHAIGSSIKLYTEQGMLFKQVHPYKGFQSSVDTKITFGLGNIEAIDSLEIIWTKGERQFVINPQLNQLHHIKYDKNSILPFKTKSETKASDPKIKNKPSTKNTPFEKHEENNYLDFYYERNIPELLSKEGPAYAKADVNGDGLQDIYIGGAAKQAGQLYLNTPQGFIKKEQAIFDKLKAFEETVAAFFDVDNDDDIDLFVGSGGNQFPSGNRALQDHLLLNDGTGNFELALHKLPKYTNNTAVIAPHDFDKDGDLDVFVGSRNYPLEYGVPPFSFLLINNGHGTFDYFTKIKDELPAFSSVGMITDAKWINVYGDHQKELVIIGDWLAPRIYHYNDTTFTEVPSNLNKKRGFWRALDSRDFNGDGFEDLIIGNIGTNFSLPFDRAHPLKLNINDFDKNGFVDKVLAKTMDGKEVPVMLKREMADQFAFIKKKNLKHREYAQQSIQAIFEEDALKSAIQKEVNYPYSIFAYGDGNGNFTIKKMPDKTQFSCINDFYVSNTDGVFQIFAGGNNFNYLPQLGRLDACSGWVLIQHKAHHRVETLEGIQLKGQLQHIDEITVNEQPHLLFIENDGMPQLHQMQRLIDTGRSEK